MISRRLTKTNKIEILEGFRSGDTFQNLAERFNCRSSTISRIIKSLITDEEFKLLKARSKKEVDSNLDDSQPKDILNKADDSVSVELEADIPKVMDDSLTQSKSEDLNKIDTFDCFQEIEPLESSFDFETDKNKCEITVLDNVSLPESVFMIVDKKVELESKLISEFPEWSFLPDDELKNRAILLFSTQRSAKRSCLKTQRVIKIPDTNIFNLSKSYLLGKGITRLIIDDSIIALDSK